MKMTNPELKVVRFNADDVIATSLYWMTSAEYEAATGEHFDTPYVWFNGSMVATGNSGEWRITNIENIQGVSEDYLGYIVGTYFEDVGVYFPGVGGISYVPYYKDGDWYTNGVSYKESIGQ